MKWNDYNINFKNHVNTNIKKVFLHIGMPKTATTSIEHTLIENIKGLRNLGYFVPNLWNGNMSVPLYSIFADNPEKCSYHINTKKSKNQIEEFNKINIIEFIKEIHKARCQMVIISGDWLSLFQTLENVRELKEFLNCIMPNACIEIIVCLRERCRFISSYIQELVKGNHNVDEIDMMNFGNLYKEHIDKYLCTFSKNNIKAYKFEDSIKHQYGPVGYFFNIIGITNNQMSAFRFIKINESLSNKAIELLWFINKKVPFYTKQGINFLRESGDTALIREIRGNNFLINHKDSTKYIQNGLKDTEWLYDNLGIDYMNYEFENHNVILYDEEYYEDILKIYDELPEMIQRITYDFFYGKVKIESSGSSKKVLKRIIQWISKNYHYIVSEAFGKYIERIEQQNQSDNQCKNQLLLKFGANMDMQNADFYRDVAVLCEQQGQLESALFFMEKAKYYRPDGPMINSKCEEYKKIMNRR